MPRFHLKDFLFSLLAIGLSACFRLSVAQVVQDWAAFYTGVGQDEVADMLVDGLGHVVVTGYGDRSSFGFGDDIITIKYSSLGDTLWTAIYDDPGHGNDRAAVIGQNASGDIFIAGYASGTQPTNPLDFITIKYNSDGVQQWLARYDGPQHGNDRAACLTVDNQGNIIVAGASNDGGLFDDYAIVKYNPAGIQQWAMRYNGIGNGEDQPLGVAANANRDVYVTGYGDGDLWGLNYNYLTLKYNSGGGFLWAAIYNGPGNGNDCAKALALDAPGNLLVAGFSAGPAGDFDYCTVKYNSAGTQQWASRYNGTGSGNDLASALAIDLDNNAYVTGSSDVSVAGVNLDFCTVKYDPSGSQIWARDYDGPVSGPDEALAVSVDDSAYAYIAGWSAGILTRQDMALISYDGSGNPRWSARYDAPAHLDDGAVALSLDAERNVYVAGVISDSATGFNWATLKYDQTFPISLDLTPLSPPIQIPPTGGSFQFNLVAQNVSDSTVLCDLWVRATFPDGTLSTPLLGPISFTFSPNLIIDKVRSQTVPAVAPAGQYVYHLYAGIYPNAVWATDSFPFEKLAAEAAGFLSDSGMAWGENQESAVAHSGSQIELQLECRPNPFNSTATIQFELPTSGFAALEVRDLLGRQIEQALPLNAIGRQWYAAGRHEIPLDGAGLSSGVYLLQLRTVNLILTRKLILLK